MSASKANAVNTAQEQLSAAILPFSYRPGQSGNPKGRPKGSRNKLGEQFLADVYDSWQVHGRATIATVARDHPVEYLKLVASLLPKECGLQPPSNALEEMSEEDLQQALKDVRQYLALHGVETSAD
jgi:hypothetical protein